jgi:hypothetical protein
MTSDDLFLASQARLILYHSQSTSARTLFLRLASGSVITPKSLPPLSTVIYRVDSVDLPAPEPEVFLHPAALVRDYCVGFGLEPALLQADGEFFQRVDTPGEILSVYLARFTCIDPPRELFAAQGGKFCAITELRGGHPAEMELLQLAYQAIMG